MFFVSVGGANRKTKVKFIIILSAFVLTVLLAVVLSLFYSRENTDKSGYVFDLNKTGGVGGFLSQFDLEYERQENVRELTLPEKDDKIFAEYASLQEKLSLDVLKFSGKKVEERYLKLKNKTEKGRQLYAVLYIFKERIIAAHLTDLEQNSELLPITAFV